jgi:FkbM family methyltransferase
MSVANLQRVKLERLGPAVARRLRLARDTVEWHAAHAARRQGRWCTNRWGHRYRAGSLADYHYLRDGNPETHEARLLERLLGPGMVVVDVGANHGLFSLEAAHWIGPSGVVHAFEPTPRTRELLLENLQANQIDCIQVFPEALGEAPGTARLRVHHELSGLNSLADDEITWNQRRLAADEVIEVPVNTLDLHAARAGLPRIDFLKIDVEGFELSVLRGARRLLGERRVGWLLLEVGDVTCANAGVQPEEILCELALSGYLMREITPSGTAGPVVQSFPAGSFSANYLALPQTAVLPCGCVATCDGRDCTACLEDPDEAGARREAWQ